MTFLLSLLGRHRQRYSPLCSGMTGIIPRMIISMNASSFLNTFSTATTATAFKTKTNTTAATAPKTKIVKTKSRTIRGLEEFFEDGKSLPNLLVDKQKVYGREWLASELRMKSFSDLHSLWFILLKEMNLLHTQRAEAKRVDLPWEGKARMVRCKFSMARIKTVLSEREDVWLRAKKVYSDSLLLKENPEHPGKTSLIWGEGEILMNIYKKMLLKNKERDRGYRKRINFIRSRRPLFH